MAKSRLTRTPTNNTSFWLDACTTAWLVDCFYSDPRSEPFFSDTQKDPNVILTEADEDVRNDPPGITAINMVSYESLMRSDELDEATKLLLRPAIVSGLIRVGMVPGFDYPGYMHRYALIWYMVYLSIIENNKNWVYTETSKGKKGVMTLGRFKGAPSPFFRCEEYKPDVNPGLEIVLNLLSQYQSLNKDSKLEKSKLTNLAKNILDLPGFETEWDPNIITFIEIDEEYIDTRLLNTPPWERKTAPKSKQKPYWPASFFQKDYWGEIKVPVEKIRELNLSWAVEEGYFIIDVNDEIL